MHDLHSVFFQHQHTLASVLAPSTAAKRSSEAHLRIVPPAVMAQNVQSDNYRKFAAVPAYYDPNSHTVFVNEHTLPSLSADTVSVVCFHELIHAASVHRSITLGEEQLFQSGIKTEQYHKHSYSCKNRLLNEGLVQFFTVTWLGVAATPYAYHREVALVQIMAQDLGVEVLRRALFEGEMGYFVQRFEEFYGKDSFRRFSRRLDAHDYRGAQGILLQQPLKSSWIAQAAFLYA